MDLLEEAPPSYRVLFTIPGFTRLVASMLLGRIGGTMVQLILVLFALDRYHSATVAGAVAFLAVAPGLVVSPIAGALLDRHGRARLVVLDYLVAAELGDGLGTLGSCHPQPPCSSIPNGVKIRPLRSCRRP
jgi:MFS family permease